jgi:predicted RNA-binding Zn-ribbon protein involved in translation (DUF1610 family)
MRLGTLKYGQAFHLDLSQKGTSSGGSRIRVRLWQCLLKNGVEIVVLSEIGKAHWEAFKALQKRFPKQLTYRPFGHTKDLDVLLVECGPTNTTFAGKDHIPYIVLANKVIAGYEGLVLYFEHDIDLGFVFTLESFGVESYFMPGYYKMAPSLDLTRDKTWVVLVQAFKPKVFTKICSTMRWPYESLHIPAENFPTPILGIEDPLPFCKHPEWDLMYIGNHRSRMQMFLSYYDYPGHVAIYGNWPQSVSNKLPHAKFLGKTAQGTSRGHLNTAACVVHIGGPKFVQTANLAPRFYEVLSSGTVLLVDNAFHFDSDVTHQYGEYMPKIPSSLYVVPANGHDMIDFVVGLDYGKRKCMWEAEWAGIEKLRENKEDLIMGRLGRIIETYEGVDLHQYERHVQYLRAYKEVLREGNPAERLKARLLDNPDSFLYCPRVCYSCGAELAAQGAVASKLRCTDCGGKYEILCRHPRKIQFSRMRRWPRYD